MSLRRKLVLSIVLLFILVTIATGVMTVLVTQQTLSDQLDRRVTQTVNRATDDGVRGPGRGEGRAAPGPGIGGDFLYLDMRGGLPDRFVAFTTDNKRIDDSTASIATINALLAANLSDRPSTVNLGDQLGSYRLIRTDRSGGTVISGLPMKPVEDTLNGIVVVTATGAALGILVLAGGAAWLIRASLRPLERVASIAGRVSRTPLASGAVQIPERVAARDTDTRTEVGQVGAALNELLDHVDSSLRARHRSETQLRQFVADASHELRTPLASIRGYAELSRRETDPVPEGISHALTRIDSESERMAHLVEDLLLLARLDAGRELAHEPVDLTMLVIDAVSDAHAAGPEHTWQLDLPEEAVETVGDSARLTQVVVNLLANARTHTPAGTTVVARVRAEGGHAVLTVTDDGPGIPEELLPRIFTRFARGDEARARVAANGTPTPSTGLGLSIVDAVVAAHRGSVDVQSRPGRTVFTVRLPLA